MPVIRLAVVMACLAIWPTLALSEAFSLFRSSTFSTGSGAILAPTMGPTPASAQAPSLFIGEDGLSFFRPYPVRHRPSDGTVYIGGTGSAIAQLRNLIGQAESRADGYDAVQYGARIKPGKRPTDMTIGEIYAWIAATPGQPHAIGRYQFIPATLKSVVNELGITQDARFSPVLQDKLGDVLLVQAGYNAFLEGQITRHAFMNNLARIWAGLPNASGKSHYHGYAGNRASLSWATFDAEMQRIYPGKG